MNSNDLYIIVITLERYNPFSFQTTNKLKLKLRELGYGKCNIKYIGINGMKLKDKKVRDTILSPRVVSFGLGSAGCALSHACVLKLIKAIKIKTNVLVLEEDALLKRDIFFLKNISNYIPEDYDICFLHSYWREAFDSQAKHEDNKKYFVKILNNKIKNPTGLNAYLINGKNINRILNIMLPIQGGIDWHFFAKSQNLNSYIINPNFNFCNNPSWDDKTQPSIRHKMDVVANKSKA